MTRRKITLREVAAYDCGHYVGMAEERAAMVAWLKCEADDHPGTDYALFVRPMREGVEAGAHLKNKGATHEE